MKKNRVQCFQALQQQLSKTIAMCVLSAFAAVLTSCSIGSDYDDVMGASPNDLVGMQAAYEGVWILEGQTLATGVVVVGETVRFVNFPYAALANYVFSDKGVDKNSSEAQWLPNEFFDLVDDKSNGIEGKVYNMGFSDVAYYNSFSDANPKASSTLRVVYNNAVSDTCRVTIAIDWTSSNMVTDNRDGSVVCRFVVKRIELTDENGGTKSRMVKEGKYYLTFTSTRRL